MKNSITLIGMPGSGKSTVGVILAKTLNKRFIDTDLNIQNQAGVTLQHYMDEHGVAALRELEQQVILTADLDNAVVATGGSAIYGEQAVTRLKAGSEMIYLQVDYHIMVERLGDYAQRGIAIDKDTTLEEMYEERHALYSRAADHVVDANQPMQIVCDTIAAYASTS